MKAIHLIGSALISAIRVSLSGMTLIRPTFAKSPVDLMTSAVPSQLLPTNITSRRSAEAFGAADTVAGAVTARTRAAAMDAACRALKADMTDLSYVWGA